MVIIGLIGKIGSGKSTASKIFSEFGFVEYAFATPIKNIAKILGFTHSQVFGTQEQKLELNDYWEISGRQFMQLFGTELCQTELPKHIPEMSNIWCRLFEIYIKENPNVNIIVSDVRFLKEANIIKNNNGILIRIIRDSPASSDLHRSETELDLIETDFIINNNKDLGELKKNIELILNSND